MRASPGSPARAALSILLCLALLVSSAGEGIAAALAIAQGHCDNAGRRTTVTNGGGKVRTYAYTDRGEPYTLTLADSSVETWTYNANGQVSIYTNPLSQQIGYAYDDAGRQTGIDYPAGTDTSFGYDNANRRTSMVDSTGTTSWTYNNAGEVTDLDTPQGNLDYTYYDSGLPGTMVETGVGTTTYVYDNAGRLTSLTNPHSEQTTFVYDDANRLTKKTFESGQYEDRVYDTRGRLTSVTLKNSSHTTLRTESYTYQDNSNVATHTVDSVQTTYGYDDIDQLTSETRTGYSASYTYDANGNRLTRTVGGVTENYAYDDADKLDDIKISGVTVKDYSYDAAGRTTSVVSSAGTTTLSWSYDNRLTGITYPNTSTNSFGYNGLGSRVSKIDSAGTHTFKRDGVGVTAPVVADGFASYTPGISERRSSTTTYEHSGLKNNAAQTGTGQTVSATRTYDAFGNVAANTGTFKGPFGYAGPFGYQEDGDSGLKLLGHRYYDSSTGRFLTRDPIKDGRNWYVYCDSDPAGSADPTGNSKFSDAFKVALLGFEGVIGGLYNESLGGAGSPAGSWDNPPTFNIRPEWQRQGPRIEPVPPGGTGPGGVPKPVGLPRTMKDFVRAMAAVADDAWNGGFIMRNIGKPLAAAVVMAVAEAALAEGHHQLTGFVDGIREKRQRDLEWWASPD